VAWRPPYCERLNGPVKKHEPQGVREIGASQPVKGILVRVPDSMCFDHISSEGVMIGHGKLLPETAQAIRRSFHSNREGPSAGLDTTHQIHRGRSLTSPGVVAGSKTDPAGQNGFGRRGGEGKKGHEERLCQAPLIRIFGGDFF